MSDTASNRSIILLTLNRLLINIPRRFPYVFLPPISKELGVATASVQSVIATQSGVGLASPLLGPLSETFGRKRVMLACMGILTAAATLGFIRPVFAVFAVIIVTFGIVKMIFDPAMQAYLADRVPYHKRGYAIGMTELSWAGSLIVVALLAGITLEQFGLGAVFLGLAIVGLIGFVALWRWLPSDHPGETQVHIKRVTPALAWRTVRESPTAQAALLFTLLLMLANEIVYINFSIWLDDTFDLAVTSLGAATIVIGAAEVIGEIVVIRVSDRFGKRRIALGGALLSSGFYLLLPFLDFHLVAALAGLFGIFIFVEASIVASISMFTEVLPNARAVMMSSNVGAASIGRLAGGLIGGLSFELLHSFHLVGALALVVGLAAAALMHFRIGEQVGTPEAI